MIELRKRQKTKTEKGQRVFTRYVQLDYLHRGSEK